MSKELVISATPHETRVAIVEDGQLCEIYVEREKELALVGSIYKGRVTRVLPGMQSAFVDIGLDGDAFLYVSDFLEGLEDYDQIVSTVEDKFQKMEQQGGQVFSPATTGETTAVEPPEVAGDSAALAEPPAPSEAAHPINRLEQPPASRPEHRPDNRMDRPRFDRGGYGRGRDRGRGGRPGRGRWGRRGGRGRRDSDLPPSKYASPRPYEPPPADYQPVILPGESLAKYKDRVPSPEPAQPSAEQVPEAQLSAPSVVEEPVALPAEKPTRLDAAPVGEPIAPSIFTAEEPAAARSDFSPSPMREPEVPAQTSEASAPLLAEFSPTPTVESLSPETEASEPELAEDEAAALAEQVAEAREEELESEAEQMAGYEESDEAVSDEEAGDSELAEGPVESTEESGVAAEESSAAEAVADTHAEPPSEGEFSAEPEQPRSARVHDDSRPRMQRPMRRGGHRRGGRFRRPERRPVPRRSQSISELLKTGQEIIVQIAKEPLGKKGARITSHVALPGRFLVYMPTLDHIGVSRKISSAEERSRLRRLLLELKGSFPGGFIVRTAAAGATDEELRTDVEFLGHTWNDIRSRAEQRKAPALLHRDLNLVERILRDQLSPDFSAIWVDNEDEFTKVVEFVNRFQPRLVNRVKLYGKEAPIFEEFGIQQEIDKALRPKVWLKSGGYIVINHTEALVAIDVNTGKFVGKGSSRLEDTIVKTNIEAVKEIVRQIRLRDLGGIIVIDFIDMEERKNRYKVMQALDEALRADKAPSKVLAFNEFGLVAITRKRTKQALERVLTQPCPYCTGSGMVKSVPTICYEIQLEARKMAQELDARSVTLRVHPEIAKALKTRESALVEELEQWTHKSVIIQADPTLHWEQYDIY